MQKALGLGAPTTPAPPVWRRLFHMAAGSAIPFLGIFLGSGVMVALLGSLSGLAILVEVVRLRSPEVNHRLVRVLKPLLKEAEARRVTGATYIAISAMVAFLVFDQPVAIVALFFLSLGDPVAAMVGRRAKGIRLGGKSPIGSLAFFAVSVAIAGLLSAGDVVPFHWALVAGAAVAALVELVPIPVDDNVTIPLVSGATMSLLGV